MPNLLSFLLLISASTNAIANDLVTYQIAIRGNFAQGKVIRDAASKPFQLPIAFENGLAILTRAKIAQAIGDQKRATQHPFSFTDPEVTKVEIEVPESFFVFSSFKGDQGKLEGKRVSPFVIGIADKSVWEMHRFSYGTTEFQLIKPRRSSFFDPDFWENSVKRIWKVYVDRFGTPTDHLVFVDLPGPISGGPLGENVLGIFAHEKLSKEAQDDMAANLGWTHPFSSTREYVHHYYPRSDHSWNEYLFGTLSHEIGHLFFGFGLTRQRISFADELWFSLGLGMVYDMEITHHLIGREPALEVDLIRHWRNTISKLKVDQHLIHPNRDSDANYKFDRKKVFAHGKSAAFLRQLRDTYGHAEFDLAVQEYVKNCRSCENGYSDFKSLLKPKGNLVNQLESAFGI